MRHKIYGTEFNYLPIGYIGELTAELVLSASEERGYLGFQRDGSVVVLAGTRLPTTLRLELDEDLLVVAKLDFGEDFEVIGRANIFRTSDLSWQHEASAFDSHRPVAQVKFCLPRDFVANPDNLLACTDIDVKDGFGHEILQALTLRAEASYLEAA